MFSKFFTSLLPHSQQAMGQSGIADCPDGQSALLCANLLRITKRALFTSVLLASSFNSLAATPPNTVITNTASANYTVSGTPVVSAGSVSVTTAGRTPSRVEFLQYSPVGTPTVVQPTLCSPSGNVTGPFVPSSGPNVLGSATPLSPIPGSYKLAPTALYARGEPVFIRVTDYDQNLNPLVAETIINKVTAPNGESETLQLTETGPSTGVFVGYIQSNGATATAGDCKLSLAPDQRATSVYKDSVDSTDTVNTAALFDPFGTVFDSSTGLAINGALITIISNATGLPAVVHGDDGVSSFPSTIPSGGTVTDGSGKVYTFPAGSYRFPQMAVGTYHFQITPPAGYRFPSTVSDASLQLLPGGPRTLPPGSRGNAFILVAGPALQIDIPLDPAGGNEIEITKTANKTVVGEGDFVPYTITIKNNNAVPLINVKIGDRLPFGFRYVKNSVTLDKTSIINPTISTDGRVLNFSIGNLAANASVTLTYVAEVTIAAKKGSAENMAFATSHSSNIGRARVTVREDLFRSSAILMGTVMDCHCDDPDDPKAVFKGVRGARIVLEDGTYIITDNDGFWHADNIRPGTHVVQLDLDSISAEYEVVNQGDNTRFAGRNFSQFVNLQAGTLWRADFYVRKTAAASKLEAETKAKAEINTQPAQTSNVEQSKQASSPANISKADTALNNKALSDSAKERNGGVQLIEQLPYDSDWLATTPASTEWLHPQTSFQPALPVIKIAVKHVPGQVVSVKVNGETVSALLYDGMAQNTARTVALSTWRAVPIKDGDNIMEVHIVDNAGKVVLNERRIIHLGNNAVKAEFIAEKSNLMADGKTRPVIAVRFLDKDNKPVRRGIQGEFDLEEPYQSASQQDNLINEPLARPVNGKARFEVMEDGIALIALMPTTQSGEAHLHFAFGDNRKQEIKAWLQPGQRDWILVGFAEGSIGHKQLSGNMEALKDAKADDKLFDQNRLAFYAKGSIKGEYLLTAAYDTAKQRTGLNGDSRDGNVQLRQQIDPNQYYTLYGDSTQPQFDAASIRKLYLKIERKTFYAMFGDYDTGLTVAEYSRYSRTVNGFKSEFKGEKFGYTAFATQSNQAFVKDEIAGNGTSGLYQLSRKGIVYNSDKIRIDTRDRFQSQNIVATKSYTRFLDYDIDYDNGTIFFKEPITSRDANLNPNFIIAEYEASDTQDEKLTYGGRANVRPNEKTEIGATLIHEGNVGATGNLKGLDATYQMTEQTKLRAEVAHTDKNLSNVSSQGNAYLAEVIHHQEGGDLRAYVRQQDADFGLGQQAGSETGSRKIGAEGRIKITETIQAKAEAYRQDTLTTNATRDVVEGRLDKKFEQADVYAGLRSAKDVDGAGTTLDSKQVIAGVNYQLLNKKISLRATTEISIEKADNTDFPDRIILGADYDITDKTRAFIEQEFARGSEYTSSTTRAGLRTVPWTGAEASSSVGNELSKDGSRTSANLGLVQKWQISKEWQADVSLDRSQTVSGSTTVSAINNNVPLASGNAVGNSSGDFTAISTGLNYSQELFNANGRIEYRDSATDNRVNLLLGAQHSLGKGETMAAGIVYTKTNAISSNSAKLDARLSYAHRPFNKAWVWLDKLDLISENQQDSSIDTKAIKLVNNFNANYMPNRRSQLALQYGAKYVLDRIDSQDYRGYTDLASAEYRHDIYSRWDLGTHISVLHSWRSHVVQYSTGVSAGYRLMDNTWLTVGYNFVGFNDDDFSGAEYRSRGVYASVKVKFDQDTLKLNELKNK